MGSFSFETCLTNVQYVRKCQHIQHLDTSKHFTIRSHIINISERHHGIFYFSSQISFFSFPTKIIIIYSVNMFQKMFGNFVLVDSFFNSCIFILLKTLISHCDNEVQLVRTINLWNEQHNETCG